MPFSKNPFQKKMGRGGRLVIKTSRFPSPRSQDSLLLFHVPELIRHPASPSSGGVSNAAVINEYWPLSLPPAFCFSVALADADAANSPLTKVQSRTTTAVVLVAYDAKTAAGTPAFPPTPPPVTTINGPLSDTFPMSNQ